MKSSNLELILFGMALVAIAMFIVAFAMPSDAIAATTAFDRYPVGHSPAAPEHFPWTSPTAVPENNQRHLPPPFWCGPWPSEWCVPPFKQQ